MRLAFACIGQVARVVGSILTFAAAAGLVAWWMGGAVIRKLFPKPERILVCSWLSEQCYGDVRQLDPIRITQHC